MDPHQLKQAFSKNTYSQTPTHILNTSYHDNHLIYHGKGDKKKLFGYPRLITPQNNTHMEMNVDPNDRKSHGLAIMNCNVEKNKSPSFHDNKVIVHRSDDKVFKRLQCLKNISLESSLYLLKSMLIGLTQAKKMLGWISFRMDYFSISESNKIITNFSKISQGQEKMTKQSLAVDKIMEEVKNIANKKFLDFYYYYQRSQRNGKEIDLKSALSLIKTYIFCAKLTPLTSIQLDSQKSLVNSQYQVSLKRVESASKYSHRLFNQDNLYNRIVHTNQKSVDKFGSIFRQNTSRINKSPINIPFKNKQIHLQFTMTLGRDSLPMQTNKHSVSCAQYTQCTQSPKKINLDNLLTNVKLSSKFLDSHKKKESVNLNWTPKLEPQESPNNKGMLNNNKITEVESIGSFSDVNISQYSSTRSESSMEESTKLKLKENEDNIIRQNCWIRKIQTLFEMKNELQYSLVLNSAKRNHARMGAIKEASVAEYQVHGKENQEFL